MKLLLFWSGLLLNDKTLKNREINDGKSKRNV